MGGTARYVYDVRENDRYEYDNDLDYGFDDQDYGNDTHSLFVGYVLWIFGIFGAHRFYFGRPVSGTIYLLTLGLLGIGWIVDLFLMPSLEESADRRYREGEVHYTAAWVLLTFLGFLDLHRFYMGKNGTGVLYLFTFGLFFLGIVYDWWTLNEQISAENHEREMDYRN